MNQPLSQECRVVCMSTSEEKETMHLLTGLHGQLVPRLLIIIMRKNAPVVDVRFCSPMGVPIRTGRPYSVNGNIE